MTWYNLFVTVHSQFICIELLTALEKPKKTVKAYEYDIKQLQWNCAMRPPRYYDHLVITTTFFWSQKNANVFPNKCTPLI